MLSDKYVRKQYQVDGSHELVRTPGQARCDKCRATTFDAYGRSLFKMPCLGKTPKPEPVTTAASGAKSSPVLPFDQIPYRLLVKLAERFQKGIPKYGRDNWRKGLADTEYVRERLAHGQRHLARLIEKVTDAHLGVVNPDDPKWEGEYWDDDVAAVAWMCAFMVDTKWQKEWELERELKGKDTNHG